MSARTQAVRGMNDLLPEETPRWQWVERTAADLLESYGYDELRLPLLERTELFQRSIGEATDIVEKEMYTFADRNGDSLTLRPEGTAGCVRACVQHGLLRGQPHRLWYAGPMFRYERPQQGRFRQFHQIGVEVFGIEAPAIDAEMILVSARLWRALGLGDVRLEINSLGAPECRARHREELVAYFEHHYDALDEDCRRRLGTNPLRILDSKNPDLQALIEAAPRLLDYLDEASREHFDLLCSMLDAAGVQYRVNPRLVRGLDYYTRTVFEWVTDRLGAQGTVCAGGRYDGLVEQLGGPATPAVGFAMGLERLVSLLGEQQSEALSRPPHAYLAAVGDAAARAAHPLAEGLRDRLPSLRLTVDAAPGSFKSKLRRADRSGCKLALILGEAEVESATVNVKTLRGEAPERSIPQAQLGEVIAEMLG